MTGLLSCLQTAWRVLGPAGVLGLTLGGIVSFVVATFYPHAASTILVQSMFLTVYVCYAEKILRAVQHDGASRQTRHLAELLGRLDDRWTRRLGDSIVDRSEKMLAMLADPTQTYKGEANLYDALTTIVDALGAGARVFAICTDKTWDAREVVGYLDANIRAVVRGVRITRVFYELSGRVSDAAEKQALAGIEAAVLRTEQLEYLTPVHHIPADLGIAIINEKVVFLHTGVGPSARACRFDCPLLAAFIRSQFEVVEVLATKVQAREGIDRRLSSSSKPKGEN